MASVRECLAEVWHNGFEESGLWITQIYGMLSIVNLANGQVKYIDLGSNQRQLTFQEWVSEVMIPLPESVTEAPTFFYEPKHNLVPELETFFLDNADSRHVNLACSASLLVLSTLFAPLVRTPWKKGKTNLFHMCVVDSGGGKSAYVNGISRIMKEVLPGFEIKLSAPGSPEALMEMMGLQNFGLLLMTEGARLLSSCEGTALNGVLKVMDSLWANEPIIGKRNRSGSIPTVDEAFASVFLQMVPHDFRTILSNPEVSVGGIASRTSWSLETPEAPSNSNEEEIPLPSIVSSLKKMALPLFRAMQDNEHDFEERKAQAKPFQEVHRKPLLMNPQEALVFEHGAKELFVDWRREYREIRKQYVETYPTLSSMYTRVAEKILRESTLVDFFEQRESERKYVRKETLLRVRRFNESIIKDTKEFFMMADAMAEHEVVRTKIINKLISKKGEMTLNDLRHGIRTKSATVFDIVIRQMLTDGAIEEYDKPTSKYKKTKTMRIPLEERINQ
jgi:DNA-binding ferritin-like protein (Dps family)